MKERRLERSRDAAFRFVENEAVIITSPLDTVTDGMNVRVNLTEAAD